MHELILICYLEATAILIIVFVTSYFFSRMREEKHSAKKFLDENVGLKGEATGLKEEKDKLRLKYDWYKTLFNNVTDMVLLHGLNDDGSPGTFIDVNHVACKCLEYTREQLLAMTPFDIEDEESSVSSAGYSGSKASGLPGDYAKKTQRKLVTMSLRNMMKQVIEKKHCRFEQVYKTRTGERISVEVDAQVLEHFSKPIIVHTARDMAALKKGQVALLESEQRLQNFFDYSPFGLAMYSADRKLVKVNRPCLRMFGIPDHAAFSGFSLFDNTFVPKSAKKGLEKGETVRYEAVINFDEAAHQGRFVTTRRGKGYLDILINSMGHDRGFSHRGYFAQIQDITKRRKVEEDLRSLQVMPDGKDDKAGISGSIEDMDFTDMIQILCAGGRSMEITLERGKEKAQVFIQNGEIVHCVSGDVVGDQAFYVLMRWRTGEFTANQCSECPERTVENSLMSLLMEGARLSDEG